MRPGKSGEARGSNTIAKAARTGGPRDGRCHGGVTPILCFLTRLKIRISIYSKLIVQRMASAGAECSNTVLRKLNLLRNIRRGRRIGF